MCPHALFLQAQSHILNADLMCHFVVLMFLKHVEQISLSSGSSTTRLQGTSHLYQVWMIPLVVQWCYDSLHYYRKRKTVLKTNVNPKVCVNSKIDKCIQQ